MLELITEFKSELLKVAKFGIDELNQMLDNGLCTYIGNYQEKYEHTKTFLVSDRTVPFYDVYFELSLMSATNRSRQKMDLNQLFQNNNCISIIGQAGSGKSMLLKHCFLTALKQSYRIPIVIELRRLNNFSSPFEHYVAEKVFNADLAKNILIFERLLKDGRFLFLLDGFDELSLTTKQKRTDEIECFIDKYPHNQYLLSSRPDACHIERFETYSVLPLTDKEVETFVHVQTNVMGEDGSDLKKKIINEIKNNTRKDISAYLANPLLLSMFILTFESHPEIPTKRSSFYFNVFDTLYSRHDTNKGGAYIHDKKAKLERAQYQTILKSFSYQTYFNHVYSFQRDVLAHYLEKVIEICRINAEFDDILYDFSVSIGILLKDGLDYCFPHRSMQEYFTALFIKSLSEKQKEEFIYPNFRNHSGVGEKTLWTLCEELDMCSFNKYFILPTLKEYIDILNPSCKDSLDDEERVDIFYKYVNLFSPEIEFNNVGEMVSLRIKGNSIYLALNEYITHNRRLVFETFFQNNEEMNTVLLKHAEVSKYGGRIYNCCTRTNEIVDLYRNCGLIDKVYNIFMILHKEYQNRSISIAEQEEQNKLLLNLWQ